jgi:heme A synthase
MPVAFARYAWAVLAVHIAVILWGTVVRATGSGAGCGSHWPDCAGAIIPHIERVDTAIELTHRITSGLALALVLIEVAWARRAFPSGHAVRRAVTAALVFDLLEAAIGAGLVLLELVGTDASPARAAWIAMHLVNTWLLVAALALAGWWSEPDRVPQQLDPRGGVGWLFATGVVVLLATGAAGAVTALGDTLFPARSLAEGLAQDTSPSAHVLVRLRVIHPILAIGAFLYLTMASGILAMQRPSPRVRRLGALLVGTMSAQIAVGLLDVAMLAPVWLQVVHLLFADVVWIALVLLGVSALAAARESRADEAVAARV